MQWTPNDPSAQWPGHSGRLSSTKPTTALLSGAKQGGTQQQLTVGQLPGTRSRQGHSHQKAIALKTREDSGSDFYSVLGPTTDPLYTWQSSWAFIPSHPFPPQSEAQPRQGGMNCLPSLGDKRQAIGCHLPNRRGVGSTTCSSCLRRLSEASSLSTCKEARAHECPPGRLSAVWARRGTC